VAEAVPVPHRAHLDLRASHSRRAMSTPVLTEATKHLDLSPPHLQVAPQEQPSKAHLPALAPSLLAALMAMDSMAMGCQENWTSARTPRRATPLRALPRYSVSR
jgi:hypothetical protein